MRRGSTAARTLRLLLAPAELRDVATLAAPAVLVQVGLMAMGVVDTVMAGHMSGQTLAAVALGNLYVFGTLVPGVGTLLALDPIVAQAVGAHDRGAITRGVQRGLVLAAALAVLSSLALLPVERVLTALRQPDDVVATAAQYARVSIPGVLPFYVFIVLRQTLQAFGRMAPIVTVVLGANVVNAMLNWVLMYGNLGAPRLGAVGSAWSTAVGRWVLALALLAAGWRELRAHLLPITRAAVRGRPLARMLALGAPSGAQLLVEFGAFGGITLMAGLFGSVALAGHEIALNVASLTFMVPLGVASAASVLVGRAVGAQDIARARVHAAAALLYGVGFMSLSGAAFVVLPRAIARLYTADAGVLAVTATLLPIAGVFQVFDGTQAVAGAVLRGTGDMRAALLANVVGFWLIGLPLGAVLAFALGVGPPGLWWGAVAGLAAVAVLLMRRVRRRLGGPVQRLRVDDDVGAQHAVT